MLAGLTFRSRLGMEGHQGARSVRAKAANSGRRGAHGVAGGGQRQGRRRARARLPQGNRARKARAARISSASIAGMVPRMAASPASSSGRAGRRAGAAGGCRACVSRARAPAAALLPHAEQLVEAGAPPPAGAGDTRLWHEVASGASGQRSSLRSALHCIAPVLCAAPALQMQGAILLALAGPCLAGVGGCTPSRGG